MDGTITKCKNQFIKVKAKMKKTIILMLVLFLAGGMGVVAQNYQDVVYLKNGSIIRGLIVEQVPNKSIKLETVDGNIFVYTMDEIEKMTKDVAKKLSRGVSFLSSSDMKSGGYIGLVELGYGIGVGDYSMDRLKLNIINGYQFNPYLAVGFGTGLRYFLDAESCLIPLFTNVRANLLDYKISPYFSLDIGYSIGVGDLDGGFLLSPTIGASFKISENNALNVGIGYEMQNLEFSWYDSYYSYGSTSENCGAFTIKVGVSF
jgi:hypothetical protein